MFGKYLRGIKLSELDNLRIESAFIYTTLSLAGAFRNKNDAFLK